MPSPIDPLRLAEHVHGHLGWLAAIALVHPAILLRNPKRRAHLAVSLSVLVVTAVGAIGVALYQPYREKLKQGIFQSAPTIGFLFERKEHLAFGVIILCWAGAVAYFAATKGGETAPARMPLRRFAFWAFVCSTCLALATATLGTIVASYRTF
jgi:hypothetical protein